MHYASNMLHIILLGMRITLLFAFIVASQLLFTSCKKSPIKDINESRQAPDIIPSVPKDTIASEKPTEYNRIIEVGTGSGNLVIDGSQLDLKCNDLILITGGKYKSIDIKNILSADGCPITIKNDGLVELVGNFAQMSIKDLKNVTISGDGTADIEKGFLFRDNSFRGVQIEGSLNQFTFQYAAFKNIGDHSIAWGYRTVYTGADNSYSKDLKFLHISSDNTHSLLSIDGAIDNGSVKGLVKNIEIAYLDFKNAPAVGAVVYLGIAEDYDIHNNRIDNVNTAIDNHNGIFGVFGSGKFHDNYISNHQGNGIRAWGVSIGTTPKNILIYNNIIANSRKYSGFEVQAFEINMIPGQTTYTNAIVFNNTCAYLNTSNDWEGNVVDVYSLKGGKCDVYNNLSYQLQANGRVAGQQAELIPKQWNNVNVKTSSEAGINESTFKLSNSSVAKNKGQATPVTIKDYYGAQRSNNTPSIGAVE